MNTTLRRALRRSSLLACAAAALMPAAAHAFPASPIVSDTFNRTSLGTNWSTKVFPSAPQAPTLVSNQLATSNSTTGWASAGWTARQFGKNQEAYATVTTLTGGVGIGACLKNHTTPATTFYYSVEIDNNGHFWLWKRKDGQQIGLYNRYAAGGAVAVGSKIGIKVTPTAVEAWLQPSGQAWKLVRSFADADAASCSGHLTVTGGGGRLDDFAGRGDDVTPPTASFTAPASGATVSGTSVSVTATAADETGGSGVARVQFLLDGVNLGAADTTAPYSVPWNTTTASNGTHTLGAIVTDNAGNAPATVTRTVTVANTTSIIRSVQAAYILPYATSLQAKTVRYEAGPGQGVVDAVGAYKNAGIKVIWLVSSTSDTSAVISTANQIRTAHPGQLVAVELENEESWSYKRTGQARIDYAKAYALRAKTIGSALRGLVPVWAIGDADNSDDSVNEWLGAMKTAVPDLGSYVDAWTAHPYGRPSGGGMTVKLERTRTGVTSRGWHAKIAVTEAGVSAYEPSPGVGRVLTYHDDLNNSAGFTYAQAASWHQQIWSYLKTYPGIVAYSVYASTDDWKDDWGTGTEPGKDLRFQADRWFGALQHSSNDTSAGPEKGAITTTVRQFLNGTL